MTDVDPEPSDVPTRVAFQNGQWVAADSLTLPMSDLALTQGVCAVERMRTYGGRLFRSSMHFHRWSKTLAALRIEGPTEDELAEIIDQLMIANRGWVGGRDVGVLMIASPGIGAEGPSAATLVVDLYAIDEVLTLERVNSGTPLVVTSVQQPPNESWSRRLKVRSRLHYYLADLEARDRINHALGVLLDQDGTVTETSIANIVLVDGVRLLSPEPDQILPGVSLQVVRELAAELGLEWREQRIDPSQLVAADEVLLTGTSCGVWFANSIDGSPRRGPGNVYSAIRQAFEAFVGINASRGS
ncbi:MAG: aminotransferase class IV [Planctomycetota bacterium]